MKVEHVKGEKPTAKEVTYPCLMKGNITGCIVFMVSDKKGTCLYVGNSETMSVGEFCDTWVISDLTPLPSTEQIILQND